MSSIEVHADTVAWKDNRGQFHHIRKDAVFIRASDGAVCISGNLLAGPLRTALTLEEAEAVGRLERVAALGMVHTG